MEPLLWLLFGLACLVLLAMRGPRALVLTIALAVIRGFIYRRM